MNLTKEELIKGAQSLWKEIISRDIVKMPDQMFGITPPDADGGWRVLNEDCEELSGLVEEDVVRRAEVLKVFAS